MRSRIPKPVYILAVLMISIPILIIAGTTGMIKGFVVDKDTGDPIPSASIMIVDNTLGAVADCDGKYLITAVKPGYYTLRVTAVGYTTLEIDSVEVRADFTTPQEITLQKATPDLSKIIRVTAKKCGIDKYAPHSQASICRESGIAFDMPSPGYPPAHGGTAIVNGEPFDAMFFKNYGVNPFVDTEDDHLSTFAIDVDDASYIMTRSYLERGFLPPDEAVRVEEFVNHFDYGYRPPQNDVFRVYLEGAPSRFGQNCQLLRIGIKGKKIRPENRKPANLIFVIDISGSMNREDRLGLVKKALRLLVNELTEEDNVGIVVYGSRGKVILEPTSIRDKQEILTAIEFLGPGGSTNAEEGLRLGYRMADEHFEKGKINRIILCSDGVANVGVTKAEDLLEWIKGFADKGITLSAIGFGMGNFNDILMEKLGNKGNGHYAYVDDIAEAKRVFVENLTGTLQVIARDVKIQVDFNPDVVRSYRLLGYENRDVDDDKFRDDKEDGGEIGSGHEVTALYEIKFHKHNSGRGIGTIYIRYKDPESFEVDEFQTDITTRIFKNSFENSSAEFRLAAAAAEFGEILRKSFWARESNIEDVMALAKEVYNEIDDADVLEFLNMISKAEQFKDQLAKK